MALHPPPTIEDELCLITQQLTNASISRPSELTFAVRDSGSLTPLAIVNAFQTVFNTFIGPQVDSQVTIQKPFVNAGNGTSTPDQATATGATIVGGNAIVSLPPQIAFLVRKRSSVGGRKNRGRTYLPWCLAQASVDENGNIHAGALSSMTTACASVLTNLSGSNIAMVIANKTLAIDGSTGKKYVTAITAGPTVTSYVPEQFIATQRRRLPRS